jgi:hypothetical protein
MAILLPQAPRATAQTVPASPVLSRATIVASPASSLLLLGEGFTPGGRVFIAVYDRWGVDIYKHVWTTAADWTQRTGSATNAASSYIPAGTVDELIDLVPTTVEGEGPGLSTSPDEDQAILNHDCGRDLMVRAWDQYMASWSNLLDVTALC